MTDVFAPEKRSQVMARVRGKDTKPELMVRRFLHSQGLRYRVNDKKLPGSPDLVFASKRSVVFVNGCFWHRHADCRKAKLPQTRTEFWRRKLAANVERDIRVSAELKEMGWYPRVVWECEINPARLEALAMQIQKGYPE